MEIRLDALVELVGGDLLAGDPATVLDGVAALGDAKAGDASFLGNKKYRAEFLATRAGAVLVPPEIQRGPEGVALIRHENPSLAFTRVVERFAEEFQRFEPGVDPRAIVMDGVELDPARVAVGPGAVIGAGAVVGPGTAIGPGVVIGRGARIGEDCLLHANVTIRERCVLGNRVVLQPGVVIGSDGYGFELVDGRHVKVPQVGIVVIEDDVEIGANSTIDRARFGETVIGEGTKIDNLVQVAHNVRIGKHCLVVAQSGLAGSSTLGDYVTIAAHSGVSGHVTVGDRVVVTGMSGVGKDLPEAGIYQGVPVRPLRESMKSKAAVVRLPELFKRVKELQREVEELRKKQ